MGDQRVMNQTSRHYEDSTTLPVSPERIFEYADNHANFSSHMNKSSWMMGGGSMNSHTDEKKFQEIGSHLQMEGTVFGIKLFLDEIVTIHKPPLQKEWKTIGDINLIVIDHYTLGFEIKPENNNSNLRVYIDYKLPKSPATRLLGYLFGNTYAKWCVGQMLNGVKKHFR